MKAWPGSQQSACFVSFCISEWSENVSDLDWLVQKQESGDGWFDFYLCNAPLRKQNVSLYAYCLPHFQRGQHCFYLQICTLQIFITLFPICLSFSISQLVLSDPKALEDKVAIKKHWKEQLNKHTIIWPKKYLTYFSEWGFPRKVQPPKSQNIVCQVL